MSSASSYFTGGENVLIAKKLLKGKWFTKCWKRCIYMRTMYTCAQCIHAHNVYRNTGIQRLRVSAFAPDQCARIWERKCKKAKMDAKF